MFPKCLHSKIKTKKNTKQQDIERSNEGKGRTFHIIDGLTVFQISLMADDTEEFSKHLTVLTQLVKSIKFVGKT